MLTGLMNNLKLYNVHQTKNRLYITLFPTNLAGAVSYGHDEKCQDQ